MLALVSPPRDFTLPYWKMVVAQQCIKVGSPPSRRKRCKFKEDVEEYMDMEVVCKP